MVHWMDREVQLSSNGEQLTLSQEEVRPVKEAIVAAEIDRLSTHHKAARTRLREEKGQTLGKHTRQLQGKWRKGRAKNIAKWMVQEWKALVKGHAPAAAREEELQERIKEIQQKNDVLTAQNVESIQAKKLYELQEGELAKKIELHAVKIDVLRKEKALAEGTAVDLQKALDFIQQMHSMHEKKATAMAKKLLRCQQAAGA